MAETVRICECSGVRMIKQGVDRRDPRPGADPKILSFCVRCNGILDDSEFLTLITKSSFMEKINGTTTDKS